MHSEGKNDERERVTLHGKRCLKKINQYILCLLQSIETLVEAFTNFYCNVWMIKLGVFLERAKICQNQNLFGLEGKPTNTNTPPLQRAKSTWVLEGDCMCMCVRVCVSCHAYVGSHANAPACENTRGTSLDTDLKKKRLK